MPFRAVNQLLDKGLCRAAVKGDMVDRHVQDHAAVCHRIERGADGDRRVEVERLGIAVDQRNDLLAEAAVFSTISGQLVAEDTHGQTVFLAVVGCKRLVRLKHSRQ